MGHAAASFSNFPVAVVDDDGSVRDALSLLLRIEGFTSRTFEDGHSFIEAAPSLSPACVVLDLHLPGWSGMEVLRQLALLKISAPVIMMSGRSDIALAVEAMKSGALDFLEKPFVASTMIDRIRDAVLGHRRTSDAAIGGLANVASLHLLTGRERDVLGLLAYGASNKEAGRRLGISPRTIEVHRARIMDKLGARNSADMMRIVLSDVRGSSRAAAVQR